MAVSCHGAGSDCKQGTWYISAVSWLSHLNPHMFMWPHFRHINVGSRFQAEIPELQERLLARVDENIASLVWKPWGDVMTNPETQDRGV